MMLGQRDGQFELSDLLYLLIFLVLPALKGLGDWVRNRTAKSAKPTEEDADFDVVVDKDGSVVLKPTTKPARPAAPAPTARPAAPAAPQRPVPAPVVRQPAPAPRPPAARPPQFEPQRKPRKTTAKARRPATPVEPPKRARPATDLIEAVETEVVPAEPSRLDVLLRHGATDKLTLKQAFVLTEIFAAPVALRRPGASLFDHIP